MNENISELQVEIEPTTSLNHWSDTSTNYWAVRTAGELGR